jgi:hypothetical protein
MKSAVARVVADNTAKRKALVLTDELGGLGEYLRSVGLDAIVARKSAQSAVEFTRLIDELLQTRPDCLGDTKRFIGPGPEHRQERRHHQHQQKQERRDCGERLAATDPDKDPLIYGIAQASKDGGQQDRQQERADHRDERGGDRRDQQEKEGLAKAGLCHDEPLDRRLRRCCYASRARPRQTAAAAPPSIRVTTPSARLLPSLKPPRSQLAGCSWLKSETERSAIAAPSRGGFVE